MKIYYFLFVLAFLEFSKFEVIDLTDDNFHDIVN